MTINNHIYTFPDLQPLGDVTFTDNDIKTFIDGKLMWNSSGQAGIRILDPTSFKTHTRISVDKTSAAEGDTVVVTVTPDNRYTLNGNAGSYNYNYVVPQQIQPNTYTGTFRSERTRQEFLAITTTVNGHQFYQEEDLEGVSLPQVISIGDYAFEHASLRSLNLPNVTTIGDSAFKESSLTSLSLPKVTTIGYSAFRESRLTSLSLPNATTIRGSAFQRSKVTSLSLPKAQTIGNYAFEWSDQLTSVSLPNATSIGLYAFKYSRLTSLSLPLATSIGDRAFSYSELTSLSIPNATSIGDSAFDEIVNSSSTHVTMKAQFNTTSEKNRIFGTGYGGSYNWSNITFTWV